MPSTSGAWWAEADTSRHVSPGCVLAGASYFCCVLTPSGSGPPAHVLFSSGSWENPESLSCPLSSSLAHEESPEVLSPRLVNCASAQLLQRGTEKTSRAPGRPCSVQSQLTSPLLTRLWVEQTPIRIPNGGVERGPPP